MILEKLKSEICTSEDFKELEFNVRSEDMGILFHILRNKLYKNPIGSICREIASNSRDANREVENLNPIEISIENDPFLQKNLTIVFKDKGPGISPQRMGQVFINYCASTKRETNNLTGGFGLGAKTPFSYTDNFTIVTIVDGIEYTYVAAVEDQKKGKIYCIEEKETLEENGTSIIVPIKKGDRGKFEEECYKATLFWDIQPIYKNFESKVNYKELYKEKNTRMVKIKGLSLRSYKLLIDEIIYDIDDNQITFAQESYYEDFNIFFEFNTGDLNISANREAIQYDKKTIDAINSRFEKFLSHIKKKIEKKIASKKDFLHACITLNDISYSDGISSGLPYFYKILKKYPTKLELKYKEKPVNTSCDNFYGIKFYLINNKCVTKLVRFDEHFKTDPIYLINRIKLSKPKNITILNKNENFIAIRFTYEREFLKFSKLSQKSKNSQRKMFRKTLESIRILRNDYNLKYKMYGKVQNVKIQSTKKKKDKNIRICARRHQALTNSSVLYARKDGIYTPLDKKLDPKEKVAIYEIDTLRNIGKYTGEEIKRWIQLVSFLSEYSIYVINKKDNRHFKEFKTYNEVLKSIPDSIFQDIFDSLTLKHEFNINDLEYLSQLEFNDEIKRHFKYFKFSKNFSYYSLPSKIKNKRELSSEAKKSKNIIESLTKKYPLLEHLSFYGHIAKKLKNEINRYIKLIDNEEKEKKDGKDKNN